jgi:hypothetical protein
MLFLIFKKVLHSSANTGTNSVDAQWKDYDRRRVRRRVKHFDRRLREVEFFKVIIDYWGVVIIMV